MSRTSRRVFAKTVAAAAALPLIGHAQTPPPPQSGKPPATESAPPKEEIKPLAAAMTGVITAQYGAHLTPEEVREVEKDFNESMSGLDRLRQIPLVNSDEPDFTFTIEAER